MREMEKRDTERGRNREIEDSERENERWNVDTGMKRE